MKIRIKFTKEGSMKFVGHLDLMRYFQKAIRRSRLNVVYTGGFSPHQVITFAQPLGTGLTSIGEYMDIELKDGESVVLPELAENGAREEGAPFCALPEELRGEAPDISSDGPVAVDVNFLRERLNSVMAEGVRILKVGILPENTGNVMSNVAAARYEITFREGKEPSFDWKRQFPVFLERSEILVVKETKKSSRELDLRPAIFEGTVTGEVIELLLDAGSGGNVKPGLVLQAFYQDNNAKWGPFDWEIRRLELFWRVDGKLQPLLE